MLGKKYSYVMRMKRITRRLIRKGGRAVGMFELYFFVLVEQYFRVYCFLVSGVREKQQIRTA